MAENPEELEEARPPRGHVRVVYLGPVVAGVAGVLVAGVVAWSLRARRATTRRLVALTARLDDEAIELAWRGGVERTLAGLEQAADTAVASLGEARLTRDRLDRAL